MEEQAIIVAAFAAAASLIVKEAATKEVKNSYDLLKESLNRVFEKTPKIMSTIQDLERNPESTATKELLVEEMMALRVDDDQLSSLFVHAEAVIRILERAGYKASLTGSGAIAQGYETVAAGSRGVAIGGDVHGSVIITGAGNAITPPEPWPRSFEVFFSYSHQDRRLCNGLERHLVLLKRQGIISAWSDRQLLPGDEWKGKIDSHLNTARIILLLVSSHFIASDYWALVQFNGNVFAF